MNSAILSTLELDMFALFEMTPDLVCIAGKDGFFRNINPAVCEKLGYTKQELLSRPIFSFMYPEDRERTGRMREKLLKGETLLNFQNRYCKKNGEIVWLEWTSVYVPDKEVVFAIAKDITRRKLLDNEIEQKYHKFKSLASYFKNSIEKDRKFMAIGLHEELAQLATVVKLDIDALRADMHDKSEAFKSKADHALAATELLINTIRKISFTISPNMLDDLGLDEVMHCLCREFTVLQGIACRYETSVEESGITKEIQLDIFRMCQEWLSNASHTPACRVLIGLEEVKTSLQLTITVEGRGFDLQTEKLPALAGIRERAASINGLVNIESEPGRRTRICVTIARE